MNVLKDYRRREEEFEQRAADFDKVNRLKDEQKTKYDQLCNQRLTEFMAGFNAISLKLKEMYQVTTCALLPRVVWHSDSSAR